MGKQVVRGAEEIYRAARMKSSLEGVALLNGDPSWATERTQNHNHVVKVRINGIICQVSQCHCQSILKGYCPAVKPEPHGSRGRDRSRDAHRHIGI